MASHKRESWNLRILPSETTENNSEKEKSRSTKYRKNLKNTNMERYQLNLVKDKERKKAGRQLLKMDQSRSTSTSFQHQGGYYI